MLTITLPFPASELMPNNRLGKNWRTSNEAKKKAYGDAYTLAYQAISQYRGPWYPTSGTVPVTLTFLPPDKRRRDLDNLLAASKSALDGVAAALCMDDREFEPMVIKRGPQAVHGAVVVEIGAIA